MTTLVTGDFHLSSNPRDSYRFEAMQRIAEVLEKRNVETLLILGDLTEAKDFHAGELVNDIVEVVYSFSCMCKVVILKGNHDYTSADCPFFHFMRRLSKVSWINEPKRLQFASGMDGFFLPHTHNYVRDWKLDGFDWKDVDWVFAHNTFEGASTEQGKRLHGIPLSVFPPRSRVISGDIHTPQTLGTRSSGPSTEVTYVGSPFLIDFGESFEPRVILIDSLTGFTSIALPGPQKRLVELKAGFKSGNVNANVQDIIKVRYSLAITERDKWPEIKADIHLKLTTAGFNVNMIQPVIDQDQHVVVKKQQAVSRKEDAKLVEDHAKRAGVSDKVLAAGMDLVKDLG